MSCVASEPNGRSGDFRSKGTLTSSTQHSNVERGFLRGVALEEVLLLAELRHQAEDICCVSSEEAGGTLGKNP